MFGMVLRSHADQFKRSLNYFGGALALLAGRHACHMPSACAFVTPSMQCSATDLSHYNASMLSSFLQSIAK